MEFKTDLEELKEYVQTHGVECNFNYTPKLKVKDVLIYYSNSYKVVTIIKYKYTGDTLYFFDQTTGEETSCDYIKKWCIIE